MMDQSCSESDVTLSPSKILERLQVLRQLQLLQRRKLQKQRIEYHETSETSSSITEVVSQFSNSTSYNTFRSLLQSSGETSKDVTPRQNASKLSPKIKEHDLIDGVSALNLSQESEFVVSSPVSSRISVLSRNENKKSPLNKSIEPKSLSKKQIALDEMPILSPKQDFETLLLEKLQNDKRPKAKSPAKDNRVLTQTKKPFLKRGEGMARFGVKKTDLIIQNTKALPWRRQSLETRVTHTPKKLKKSDKVDVQIVVNESKDTSNNSNRNTSKVANSIEKPRPSAPVVLDKPLENVNTNNNNLTNNKPTTSIQLHLDRHPLQKSGKSTTWAAVLTKEQDDFLRQLKQSDYYKNFTSPAKSVISDISYDESLSRLRQERETAEQNMFELLENKVTHQSFSMENSFLNKFLRRSMECSGESTPMMMKRCLANNPGLLHIFPEVHVKRNEHSECSCEYTDCSDACSTTSSCSCKTEQETNKTLTEDKAPIKANKKVNKQKDLVKTKRIEDENDNVTTQDDTVNETDAMKADMAEMNAKLFATSELIQDRLRELEDEIETFRKENNSLAKMREEIDLERQKFYQEKSVFEQKFNEEKILAEYYLAEEKEKLTKQKQTYERYVREVRGRLNKKEKDEVLNLKKEINDLKDEIRQKDAKSTSTIARLRNQMKIIEKEKANLQDEVEKLKKENRRIQHSNEITRRLTNVKYLEQINKKLTHMAKTPQSEVDIDRDVKYKAFEIERQSRSRKAQPVAKGVIRPRAKSVPNLKVTSRYAKYFSQRDAASQREEVESLHPDIDKFCASDEENIDNDKLLLDETDFSEDDFNLPNEEEENNLEKIYMERFQNVSPVSNRSSLSTTNENCTIKENPDPFFIRKSNSNLRESRSPVEKSYQNVMSTINRTKSPISILSNRSSGHKSPIENLYTKSHSGESRTSINRSKSPTSILSNKSSVHKSSIENLYTKSHSGESHSSSSRSKSPVSILSNKSSSQRLATVVNQENHRDKLMTVSPEPSTSKTSLSKTNLNPTEIKKPDGSRELRFPNGNVKYLSADGKYSKFVYYNGDVKENFYSEGRIKYFYAEAKTCHTTHADGLEVLEFPDGQVEKRYKDGSSEIRLPNGSIRYHDPKNIHVREEWRFPDGTALTVSAAGEQRTTYSNGQVEVHAKDHKRREYPDGTVKLVYNDGTSETRYASGRVRIKDKHGNLIMDSAPA